MVRSVVAFAAVPVVGNLTTHDFFDVGLLFAADPQVHLAVAVLRGLEFAALAFLTYVTLK